MISDKKILVTGGNGFLGSHLVETLIKEENISRDKIFSPHSSEYDLRKESDVAKMFETFSPDIVVHLATTAKGMGYNKDHPATLYYDHAMMNTLLMHYAVKHKVKKFVIIGTALAYPYNAQIPLKEDSIWEGSCEPTVETIGVTSRAMLTQSQAYRKEFGLNSIYLIPANLYGPRDHFSSTHAHVIPATILKFHKAILENGPNVEIWGTGKASREFLHIKDDARAIIECIKNYDKPEPLNLASGEEIKIHELVDKVNNLMKYKGEIIWDSTKPEGALRRCLEGSRMRAEIDFKPNIKFNEGIRETVEWYLDNYLNI